MTRHVRFLCTSFLMLIWVALPTHATTTCVQDFTSGNGNTYVAYCVTVNEYSGDRDPVRTKYAWCQW
jgi:hypothetical protein